MVYLIAALGAAAVASLGLTFYALWVLKSLPESGLEDEHRRIWHDIRHLDEVVSDHSRTLAAVQEQMPVIRGEVAEALTRVDSRFNAARAAEERTRRIARNAAEEEDGGETLSEQEFLALTASSAPEEPDAHQLTWPDLERIAFERRHGNRRG